MLIGLSKKNAKANGFVTMDLARTQFYFPNVYHTFKLAIICVMLKSVLWEIHNDMQNIFLCQKSPDVKQHAFDLF